MLQRRVGEYVLTPAFTLSITREGTALFLQATGQPKFPIFAESETAFFFRVADAQLTFTKDASGSVTGLILHQGGQNLPGRRK